jgi:REP-associated tyrosine transposase
MKFDPEIHHRRSIRLGGYDYSQPGAYFLTVCVSGKEHLFGEIVEGQMLANERGELVARQWSDLPRHYPEIRLDAFCVMPNHVHGIIEIVAPDVRAIRESSGQKPRAEHTVGAIHESPLRRRRMLLPRIIGRFKMNTTKRINQVNGTAGRSVWQRNYYEHIIRNSRELDIIREYISTNPVRWSADPENMA